MRGLSVPSETPANTRPAQEDNMSLTSKLKHELKAIISLYEKRGFVISRVEGDREFSPIAADILPIALNVADADDHVAQVERSIRAVKDRCRCTVQGLPFRRFPKILTKAIVEEANASQNLFPAVDGVSDTMSPLTIVTTWA